MVGQYVYVDVCIYIYIFYVVIYLANDQMLLSTIELIINH